MSNKENIKTNSQYYRHNLIILPVENINYKNEFQDILNISANCYIQDVHVYLLNNSGESITSKIFPNEISQATFKTYQTYLEASTSSENITFAQYDPTCVKNGVIPTLSTQSLPNWSKIKEACDKELTNNEQIKKEDYLESNGNLIVIKINARFSDKPVEEIYFLSRRRTPPAIYSNANYFMHFYLGDNGQFALENRSFLVLPSTVDVVIRNEVGYIFSVENFKHIFGANNCIIKSKYITDSISFIDDVSNFYQFSNHEIYVNHKNAKDILSYLLPEIDYERIKASIEKFKDFEDKLPKDEKNKIGIIDKYIRAIIDFRLRKFNLDILTNKLKGL